MPDSLHDLQTGFAAHLRNPGIHPAPADVEDRRMAIYRRLFFRNISNFLAKSFPVLRTLYSSDDWNVMVRDFYHGHRAHTPLFPEIPREFLQWLEHRGEARDADPPFMLELAHYEWVEIALDLDPRELAEFTPPRAGDLLDGCPVLSPLAWPLSYAWPVHRIRPDYRPAEPPTDATHLLVYRDRADKVRFMQLNPVSLRLLQLLGEDAGLTGRQALEHIATELQHHEPQRVIEAGSELLADFAERDVLLGARPA
jgi:hypothetical protein